MQNILFMVFPPLLIYCLLRSSEFEDDRYYKNAGLLSVLEKNKYESFSDCPTMDLSDVVPFGVWITLILRTFPTDFISSICLIKIS